MKYQGEYKVSEEIQSFFINGYTKLQIKNNSLTSKIFNKCDDLNKGLMSKDTYWEKNYKYSEDLKPNAYVYREFIDFIFDQNFHKKINYLTGQKMILGDFSIRRTFPNKKSYMFWHRDTHFYKNKKASGRMPPIYKIIVYVPNDDLQTSQLKISPKSHHKMYDNKIVDFASAFFGKKIEIKSSKVECIFLNTMLMHSVVNSLIDKKPTIRLFYNFCLESQLNEFPGRDDLQNDYMSRLSAL